MPYVEAETVVKADPQRVYEVVKNTADYPEFMPAVDKITIESSEPGRQVSVWEAKLKGAAMKWREEDIAYDDELRIHYDLLSGDLKVFRGDWTCETHPEGTLLKVTCEFEIGIPMFAAMLNPVAKLVVKENCESMLAGIKEHAEKLG
ncbi:MAG TPA: cyclase [Firmicutes bacterium]|jgi:coenzyme Q-binding protein COQ10|nr:cyclase [Bacillota bacterium]